MAESPSSSPPQPLARFGATLHTLRGAQRIDALISQDDAAAAIAALTPTEVYELVQEVGFEDAGDLIALATPEQVQGCLDFAGWDKDELEIASVRPWLAALIDAGFEKLGEVWAGLDPEVRMLYLQRQVEVFDVTLGEGPEEDDETPMMATSDGFFVLKLLGDEAAQRLTQQLVEDLYRADANLARHTILGARSEPAADLEEMSYRWRNGRLADLGYIDFYDALELFHPLDAEQVGAGQPDEAPATLVDTTAVLLPPSAAKEILARPFLARCLTEIHQADELADLESAVAYLVNRVLAAARAKPGQQDVVQRAASYASATLSLGLEATARGEPRRGAALLRTTSLPRLFRVGYTLTLRLAKLALSLAPRAALAESPLKEVVTALASPRPLWSRQADRPGPSARGEDPDGSAGGAGARSPRGIDRPGPSARGEPSAHSKPSARGPSAGVRPFESLADVRRATEVLGSLAMRIALAEKLGVDLLAAAKAPEPRPSLETYLRTAMARVAAGGAWSGGGLSGAELQALRSRGLTGAKLSTEARRRVHEAVATSLAAEQLLAGAVSLPAMVDELLAQIEATVGGITDREIDPRFIEGLLVQAPGS
jgi:Family of unknown function (DUF6178)